MEDKFESLKQGEVICVDEPAQFFIGQQTFRVSELVTALKQALLQSSSQEINDTQLAWLSGEGSECNVLRFGTSGWQKGKLRIELQFCPDPSASQQESVEVKEQPLQPIEPEDDGLEQMFAAEEETPVSSVTSETATTEFIAPKETPTAVVEEQLVSSLNSEFSHDRPTLTEVDDIDWIDAVTSEVEDTTEGTDTRAEPNVAENPIPELPDDDDFDFPDLSLDDEDESTTSSDFDNVWQGL